MANGRAAYQDRDPVDVGLFGRVDAGPVRLRRNGRQTKAVGLYFSVKSGRHLPYESKLELHDLWRAEVDTRVVRSLPQPFCLKMVIGGTPARYTPDRLDALADRSMAVVEIKDQLSPDEAQSRYAPIARLLLARGFQFELRQRAQIEAEPSLSGIEAVQRHRRTQLAEDDVIRLRRCLAAGAIPLGALAERVCAGPAGMARVCAAVVGRLVRIDLAQGLHADAAVELVA